jgi:hypothetical protein
MAGMNKVRSSSGLPMAEMNKVRSSSGLPMNSAMRRANQDPEYPGFFASLSKAFLMPLRGRGISWMLMLGVCSFLSIFVLIGTLFIPFVGVFLRLAVLAFLLTLNARFFFSTFSAALVNDNEPGPVPDIRNDQKELLISGMVLFLWFVTAYLPLYFWQKTYGIPPQQFTIQWLPYVLLLFLPFYLWPISLVQMTAGSLLGMWNFPRIILRILRVHIRYFMIVLFGFIAGIIPFFIAHLISTKTSGFIIGASILFIACLSSGYAHGVMGSMVGDLALKQPDILPQDSSEE